MASFTVYVAGPVLRPGAELAPRVGWLFAELEATAKAHGMQLVLPTYSERLDRLAAHPFAQEIRDRIGKTDATIAVIARPASAQDISGHSIAMEAHETALAGKPIALLLEDADLPPPRLLAALDRVSIYAFGGPGTLDALFENLAKDLNDMAR
ncbi:hypothetical protein [Devosia insulae]|nr:hypothetical protein [Devosia insulae]